MADIQVARPESGVEVRVPAEQGASFVLEFPLEDILRGARDNTNLVLETKDGGNVVFENFYDTFNANEKPQFVADGAILDSKDFFTGNLDSSLDPAAGPAAGPAVANGGRYRDYTNAALATGIDHLTRLDYNSDRGFEWDDAGWITRPDDEGYLLGVGGAAPGVIPPLVPAAPVNHPVSIVPGNPWTPDPNIPEFPGGPDNPWNPDGSNMDVNSPRSAVRVHEKNIGTSDAIQEESFIINAPDGVGSIKIGNTVVWENGKLVPEADRTFPTDEGKLTITGFDPDTGRLTYTFELTSPTDEHTKPGEDSISHSFKVTVTDTDGDTASSYITVIIEDDIPEAGNDFDKVNEGETVTGTVLVNDNHGQDGPGTFGEDGPAVKWDLPEGATRVEPAGGKPYYEVETPEGTAKLYDDGSYEFTGKDIVETTDVSFGYTIVDSDGDEARATLTITVVANTPTITPEVPEPDPTPDPTPDPDDPNPKPIPSTPSGESGKIVVDEGAMAGGTGGDGHGASGVGLIGVNLNGDSKGTIQIGDATLNIEGGKLVGFEETEAATVDGVKVTVTGATFNAATGKWDVSYKYELVEAQKHKDPSQSGADDKITGGTIDITVTDASGDVATGQLTVEVHDDAPVVGVVEGTQTVVINMGADVNEALDQMAQVFLKGSDEPLEWFSKDGTAEYGNDIELLVNGTYVSGNIIMVKDDNGYHFKVGGDATEDVELVVRATDADKDSAETPVKLTVPTVTPEIPQIPVPDPENPGPDVPLVKLPGADKGQIIVDESALPGGVGEHTEHGAAGTGVIVVDLKGDTEGSIQVGNATLNIEGGHLVGFKDTEAGTVDGVKVTVTGAVFNEVTKKWDVSYKYELETAQDHNVAGASGADDKITGGKIDITVTDATGDVATGKLTIEVHDDAPEVTVAKQTVTIAMGADKGGSDKVEVILDDKVLEWGNDDFSDVTDVNDLPVGAYESGNIVLTKNEDGSYSFRFKDGSDKDVTLQVKATDRDGDSDSEDVTLKAPTIEPEIPQIPVPDPENPGPDVPLVNLPGADKGQIIVDEAALEGASGKGDGHGAAGQGTITVNLRGDTDGVIIVGSATIRIVGGEPQPVENGVLADVNGVIVTVLGASQNDNGEWIVSYKYELTGKQDHDDPKNPGGNQNVTDTSITGGSIPVSVTDSDGDVATGNLTIEVHDDVPEVFVDKQTVTIAMGADKGGTDKVEVFAEGESDFPMVWKPEGSDEVKGISDIDSLEAGRYESGGVIMIKTEDGKYTFKLKDVSSDEDPRADVTLTVKATDSDGDEAPKEVVLKYPTIEPEIPQIPVPDPENPGPDVPLVNLPGADKGQIIADEAAMANGSGDHDDHGATGTGVIVVDLKGDTEGSIQVGNATLNIEGGDLVGFEETEAGTVDGVKVTVTGAVFNKVTNKWYVSYKYELETAQDHDNPKASGADDKITGHKIDITVTDADGDVSTGKLTIEVHDDAPVLKITENNSYNGKLDLAFGADGKLAGDYLTATMNGETVQAAEADGVYAFTFANGDVLTVTPAGDGYAYDFKPIQGTAITMEPADITLKATDGDKDVAEATLKVGENKTPTISVPPTQKPDVITEENPRDPSHAPYDGHATIVVDEGALAHGTGQHTAHGTSGNGHLLFGVNGEPGGWIDLAYDSQLHTINLPTLAEGQTSLKLEQPITINVNGLAVTFDELVLVEGTPSQPIQWQLNYSYKYDPNTRHDHTEHDRVDNSSSEVNSEGEETGTNGSLGAIKVTVTDGIGNQTAYDYITIEIHDDVPMVNTSEVTGSEISGEVQKTLNFVTDKVVNGGSEFEDSNLGDSAWDYMGFTNDAGITFDNGQNGYAVGMNNGFQIFSSSVQYYYNNVDGVWYLDRVEDRHGKNDKQVDDGFDNDTANIGGRNQLHMSPDGLYIAGKGTATANWGDTTIGTKPIETAGNEKYGTNAGMSHAAESIMLENYNNIPSYGFNIEFGKFYAGDKAVITFYLTPTSSNDDTVVYTKIITKDDLAWDESTGIGSINIAVPDGFTKVIVSPLPGGDLFDQYSDFTIRQIDFTRPAYSYEGAASVVAGQDGVAEGSLKWDWSDIKKALETDGVDVTNTIGSRHYEVSVDCDDTTVTVTLLGDAGEGSLGGSVLFKGELNADGTWTVTQFYNFKVAGKEPVFDFKFSITDMDDDVITADQKLDMSKPVIKDRFDSAQDGLYSKDSDDTIDHHEYDYLVGKVENGQENNDLLYGREGNDVMFGDSEDGNALEHLNTVLKTNIKLTDISDAKTGINDVNNTGNNQTNKAGFETLKDALNKAAADGKLDEKLTQLESLQGKDGGDDALFGGAGSDILIGGSGDDYLVGNGRENTRVDGGLPTDRDILLGGVGNDIIVYGKNDYIIDGGSGIDFLLAGKDDPRLAQMDTTIGTGDNDANPYVNNFEVQITALHTSDVTQLGITSLKSLANYGVRLIGEGDRQTLELGPDWVAVGTDAKGNQVYTYKNGEVSLRLETSLKPVHNQMVLKETDKDPINNKAEGGTGSDVLFGHNVQLADVAEVAGLLTVLGLQSGASQEAIAAAIKANPEVVANHLAEHGASHGNAFSNSVGGDGDDYLFGQNSSDALMGDANVKKDIIGLLHKGDSEQTRDAFAELEKAYDENEHETLVKFGEDLEANVEKSDTLNDGNDMLFSGGGKDLVYGGGGDDVLMGGDGSDILIGGSGDDYLNGGADGDYLYGGSGNDIIVFDKADYVIDGGSGIDILIAGQDGMGENLGDLLKGETGPVVNNIDVFIKGIDVNTMGLTDMDKLASELGIRIDDNTLHLEGWKLVDKGSDGIGVYAKDNMVLETSLPDTRVQLESQENLALQQFQHEASNGNL